MPWGTREELPDEVREQFRARDADALAVVYDRYHRLVWAVTLRTTGAEHFAQEAMQDTFVRAWEAAASYDPARPMGPWLATIARRTSLDLLRRELRPTRGGHEEETDVGVELPGIDEAWLCWEVREAVERLPEDEREVVRLSFFDDLTQTQVAERLGLPVGTVKSRSHRAHKRLAGVLGHVRQPVTDLDGPDVNRTGGPRRTSPGPGGRTHGEERR